MCQRRIAVLGWSLALFTACSGTHAPEEQPGRDDSPSDGSVIDAGVIDAGAINTGSIDTSADGSTPIDASPIDAASIDASSGGGATIDPAWDPGDELSVRCVSEYADPREVRADAQRYRFIAPLGRRALITINLGDANLFGTDEGTALAYAGDDTEVYGSAKLVREIDAELLMNGDIRITWDDGEVEALRTFNWGMFSATGSFAGDERQLLCWRSDYEPAYRYNAQSGQCVNEHHAVGRNDLPLLYVHETGNGECNDFGDNEISAFGWPVYAGFNLRGADLSQAGIHFATMPDADFSGADLSVIDVGYFVGNGRIDRHTKLPEGFLGVVDGTISFGDGNVPFAEQPPYYAWLYPCASRPAASHCVDID